MNDLIGRDPETGEPSGFRAPSQTIYDVGLAHARLYPDIDKVITFPEVRVRRGGFTFPKPGTPEWEQARFRSEHAEIVRRYVDRAIGDMRQAQDAALSTALVDAIRLDMGVRLERPNHSRMLIRQRVNFHNDSVTMPGPYRFIGIEITPEVPTGYIHEIIHTDPWGDDW